MSTEIVVNKDQRPNLEYVFWHTPKHLEIYTMVTEGKSIDEIAKLLKLKDVTVTWIINNKYFNDRLKAHLDQKLYDLQIKKIDYMPKAFELLRVEFEKRIKDAKGDAILTNFLKLLLLKLDKSNISPNMVNIILGDILGKGVARIPRTVELEPEPEKIIDNEAPLSDEERLRLGEKFGYALPEPQDEPIKNQEDANKTNQSKESGREDIEMDGSDKVKDEQGSED